MNKKLTFHIWLKLVFINTKTLQHLNYTSNSFIEIHLM